MHGHGPRVRRRRRPRIVVPPLPTGGQLDFGLSATGVLLALFQEF